MNEAPGKGFAREDLPGDRGQRCGAYPIEELATPSVVAEEGGEGASNGPGRGGANGSVKLPPAPLELLVVEVVVQLNETGGGAHPSILTGMTGVDFGTVN